MSNRVAHLIEANATFSPAPPDSLRCTTEIVHSVNYQTSTRQGPTVWAFVEQRLTVPAAPPDRDRFG